MTRNTLARLEANRQIAALRSDLWRRTSAATGIPVTPPAELPALTPLGGDSVRNTFNIQNSAIGLLSVGEQQSLRSIQVNLTAIERHGQADLGAAIQHLTEAVTQSSDLASSTKAAVLECLEELSSQALRPPAQRSTPGAIRAVVGSLHAALNASGSLAEVWGTWGPAIKTFFGV